ncbi:LysR family transcriptional regulator [Variovorax atrisoli]|uniref:LysR family transcriptional regulator n=1 Tax=Variovorax atrisoli TaxID=3394203 RepID=UPI00161B1384|nr:LysR family transcriptional regulator [Variovorax sp. BK613]MBB3641672.1 DNA-binding transcriptional LysR family regulator [Variovorax sp. BK613]
MQSSDNQNDLNDYSPNMNITLRQIKAFLAVADTGAFARAAERMHVSPSALSTLVKELEAQIGLKLFHRSTRVVQLTEAGAEFRPLARKALDDLEAAVAGSRALAQVKRGRVTVAASIVVAATLLPWVMQSFRQRHPGIQCILKDGFEETIRDQVRRGEVDLGVGTLIEGEPGLSEVTLYRDHLVALMPDGHPLTQRGSVSWRELAQHPLVCLPERSPSRALADDAFEAAGLKPVPAYEATFSSTLISMVAAGMGVAALPVNVRQLSGRTGVQARMLVRPTVKRQMGVYWRNDAALTPAANAFLKHLQSFVRTNRGLPDEAADVDSR